MYKCLIPAILSLCCFRSIAQIPYADSKVLINAGVELYDKGEYKKAIEQYAQVNECDTNYLDALYEEALAFNADSAYETAERLALRGLSSPHSNKRDFFYVLAASYDYQKKSDSALFIYDSLSVLYPNDNQAWYEKGIYWFRKLQYDKALGYFQKSLMLNPNHFNSYYMAGNLYILQGRLSEALMALQMSLLVTQNTAMAKKSIALISSVTEETDEVVKLYHEKKEQYSHPLFDDIDQIINAKLALSSGYKLKISLNDDVFRQLQLVCEKVKYDAADTNFAMQYFVPLLANVYNSDRFEPYMLFTFSGYGLENIDKLAEKNKKEVEEIRVLVQSYLDSIQSTRELNYSKRQKAKHLYHFYPKDNFIMVGESHGAGNDEYIVGDAALYHSNHALAGRGRYNMQGKKEGEWVYYYNSGRTRVRERYKNGELTDTAWAYYGNGNLSRISVRNAEGNVVTEFDYNYAGWLSESRKKLPGDRVEEISFYPNGRKESTFLSKNGEVIDGTYNVYYRNGMVKRVEKIAGGKYSGEVKEYYDNGVLSSKSNYEKGTQDGPYESYYETGIIKEKGSYSNGKESGPYEEYYYNGRIAEKGTYNKGNKEEVTKYAPDGKVFCAINLSSGVPYKIKFTGEDGAVLSDVNDSKGIYDYPLYFACGTKAVDMKLNENGMRDGVLTFYYPTGSRDEVTSYKNGEADGISKAYYKNGQIRNELNYTSGQLDGYYKTYYRNGAVEAEGWYKEGKKQGLWRYYYVNGKLSAEKYFLNDELNGFFKSYNVNGEMEDKYIYDYGLAVTHICYDTMGNVTDSIAYQNDSGHYRVFYQQSNRTVPLVEYSTKYTYMHGPLEYRYANGALRKKEFYNYDFQDSTGIYYYPNGVVQSKGAYRQGATTGKWFFYNDAGELEDEVNYNLHGAQHGKRKSYACNALRIEYNFRDGEKDSAQIYYGENGRVAFILFYDDGELTGYTHEGKDGRLLPMIKVKNGTADMVTYYSNGKKSGEAVFKEGIVQGAQRVYYSNGQLAEERNIKNGDLDGPFRRYNEDGRLVYEFNNKDDEGEGIERTYDKNGNLIIAAGYHCGKLHGPTAITDPATGKTNTYYYRYGTLTSYNQ